MRKKKYFCYLVDNVFLLCITLHTFWHKDYFFSLPFMLTCNTYISCLKGQPLNFGTFFSEFMLCNSISNIKNNRSYLTLILVKIKHIQFHKKMLSHPITFLFMKGKVKKYCQNVYMKSGSINFDFLKGIFCLLIFQCFF